jgi:TRAP-type C4-dicarboxylate transport system substrate-binding protein
MIRHGLLALAAVAGAAAAGPAVAETIKLTVVAAPPPTAQPVRATAQFFIPEINKRLAAGGHDLKIEWTEAYSSTLASITEVFSTVEKGIAQVGVIITTFEEAKIPLEQVSVMVPFAIDDSRAVGRVFEEVHDKIPQMNQAWEKYNQVYLGSMVSDAWHFASTFPLRRYEDLNGRRIGGSGTSGSYIRNTGAVLVSDTMLKAFSNIKNGVYEGYAAPISLMFPFKIHEAAPHVTKVNFGAVVGAAVSMNRRAWDRLPKYAKDIFVQVGREKADWAAVDAIQTAARFEGMMKSAGAKVEDMSDAERRRWAAVLPNIAREWSDRLEKEGVPAKATLAAYMDGLRATGKPIARNWDRE